MKKLFCILLIAVFLFGFCSCAENEITKNLNDMLISDIYTDWDSYSSEKSSDGSAYKNFFSRLSDNQKKAYNKIYSDIMNAEDAFPEKIEVPLMDSDELSAVYEAVIYDNPEIMCFGKNADIITEGSLCFFKPEYTMIPAELHYRIELMNEKAEKILSGFAQNASVFDMELFIHDYIIENCIYDCDTDDSGSAYACLICGYASCEGYSNATKFLLEKAGIECYNILGIAENSQGETENHMWNVVSVGGNFYHLDTTWDDPVSNSESVSHIYFNLTEDEILYDHSDFISDFICTATDENYFVRTGTVFYSSDYYARLKMEDAIVSAFNSGRNCIQLRFTNKTAYDNAVYELTGLGKIYGMRDNIKYRHPEFSMAETINYIKYDKFFVIEFLF